MLKLAHLFYSHLKGFIKNPIFKIELSFLILREKIKGIETYKPVSIDNLNIPLELEPVYYESSGNSYLGNILKDFNISSNDSIIDFGCGKAGALIYMTKFPFKEIIGIEYSELVYLQAKKNLKKLNTDNIKIINCDARKYTDIDEINYIYFYNPFGVSVLEEVLSNIKQSHLNNPRDIKIIYKNPIHHKVIESSGLFKKIAEYKTEYKNKFYVYCIK